MTDSISFVPRERSRAWPDRVTLTEYLELLDLGVFPAEARTELIEGEVYFMGSIGDAHAGVVDSLNYQTNRQLGGSVIVRVQNPLKLPPHSMPQPDMMILRFNQTFYREEGVYPADVHLLIEVSDSTLQSDLTQKRSLYATANVPEYWVVDIPHGLIHQFSSPVNGDYRQHQQHPRGATITSLTLPTLSFAVNDILGGETA